MLSRNKLTLKNKNLFYDTKTLTILSWPENNGRDHQQGDGSLILQPLRNFQK